MEYMKHSAKQGQYSKDEILWNIACGIIEDRDYFILKCLYTLGMCTVEAFTNYLKSEVKNLGSLSPIEPEYQTRDYLQKKLWFLSKKGLVGHYKYNVTGRKVDINDFVYVSSFFITYEGYTAVKAHYELTGRYRFDDEVMYFSSSNAFRHTAIKCISTCLSKRREKVKIYGEHYVPFPDPELKGRQDEVMTMATVTRNDGTKIHFVCEPMFYAFDPSKMSEEAVLERNAERFEKMKRVVTKFMEAGEEAYLVVAVENIEGMRKFENFAANSNDIGFISERCLVTSDNMMCQGLQENFDESLLQLEFSDGAATYKSRKVFD